MENATQTAEKKIRYAVVGLGHIAQVAVLPAFKNAAANSELTALVSDDPTKLKELGKKYRVKQLYSYDEYDQCLKSDTVDAVFIALPNHLHREYTVRAAEAGRHVLCEKPLAMTEEECRLMMEACRANSVQLMTAYRLHFDEATLKAIEIVQSGQLGDLNHFDSFHCMDVKPGNIRLQDETGGGTLHDIGIYCINAARSLFRDEPIEMFAMSLNGNDPKFAEVEEAVSAILRFPRNRTAVFTCSFGSAKVSSYRVVGTEGDLRVEPGYSYTERLTHHLTIDRKTKKRSFAKRDQFAAQLLYFSDCVRNDREPEPSGLEGAADVRIIEALYRSVAEGKPVSLVPVLKPERPSPEQEIYRPPVNEPELVHAESPGQS
ncbi:MAG: Gfo/Idh/MocA family oxidoreductase [Pirellulales bacterium]